MNIRKIVLLVFSLIFTLVLVYLVYNLLNSVSGEDIVVDIEYIEVLVANNEIYEAALITNKDIKFIKLPKDLNISEYFTDKSLVVARYAAEKNNGDEIVHPDISKLLLQNIKVLSIDQDSVGETLLKIAKDVYDDSSKYTVIIRANNIANPSHIVTEIKLIIPKIEN